MRRWKKIMALCFAFLMSFVMFGSSVEAANGQNEQDWSSAVSYTHLDVYKRQNMMRFTVSGHRMRK